MVDELEGLVGVAEEGVDEGEDEALEGEGAVGPDFEVGESVDDKFDLNLLHFELELGLGSALFPVLPEVEDEFEDAEEQSGVVGFPHEVVALDEQEQEGVQQFEVQQDVVQELVALVHHSCDSQHFEEASEQLNHLLRSLLQFLQATAQPFQNKKNGLKTPELKVNVQHFWTLGGR